MLTARGVGLLAAAVSCLIAGRLVGIPQLDAVAVAAVGVVLAAVLLNFRPMRLRVDRPASLSVTAHGEPIPISLVLFNDSGVSLGAVDVTDDTPSDLHSGATAMLAGLSPGARVPLSYRAVGRRRGRHVFGPTRVIITDPLTIARRRLTLPATTEVIVLPRVVALPDTLHVVAGRVPGDQGAGLAQAVGDDVGVIREYHVGDDLRRIHWPATAHRGELMVRQTESRQRDRVVILLDRSPTRQFELLVEIAASIGAAFAGRGVTVQLIDDPHELQTSVLPWEVQLERLASIPAQQTDMASLTAMLAGGVAGGGTLMVVSAGRDSLATTLQRLGRSFDRRIAVVGLAGRSSSIQEPTMAAVATPGWQVLAVDSLDDLPARWQDLHLRRSA